MNKWFRLICISILFILGNVFQTYFGFQFFENNGFFASDCLQTISNSCTFEYRIWENAILGCLIAFLPLRLILLKILKHHYLYFLPILISILWICIAAGIWQLYIGDYQAASVSEMYLQTWNETYPFLFLAFFPVSIIMIWLEKKQVL